MMRDKLTRVKANNSRFLPAFILAIIAAGAIAAAGAARAAEPRVEITTPDGRTLAVINVEIANNDASREVGLMYRKSLGADDGMLFVFKRPAHQTFWMKNTEIPLDMIFAGADGRVIGIVADAAPYSEKLLSVNGDSQYVLEVNGGFAGKHEIAAGDILKFVGFVPRAAE